MKPLLSVSAGEPAGIGPEITVKALRDRRVRSACKVILTGDRISLQAAGWKEADAPLLDTGTGQILKQRQPSEYGGAVSFKAVSLAVKLALNRRTDGVVTAPVSKESWAMAKTGFTGHTEFLRQACESPDATMMFVAGKLRAALVTEHYPINRLAKVITKQRIITAAETFSKALVSLGIKKPSIAVCALNPHAGDGGNIGTEEIKTIRPAITALRSAGIRAEGPFPSDSAWIKHGAGEFHGILCMYHDQALAPLKMAPHDGAIVHWTFGLPFIRTSPAHGTAFDIAGRGVADAESMVQALLFAARHCSHR